MSSRTKAAHAPNFFVDARNLGRLVILTAERRDFRFSIASKAARFGTEIEPIRTIQTPFRCVSDAAAAELKIQPLPHSAA
jgi:GDP-D-mannose dehydratase